MIRACLPQMIERGWGRIINIGSTAATTATADHAAYCASKSGLLGLSRAVALEGAPHGVSSVVISPTWVETEMMANSMAIQARDNAGTSVERGIAGLSSEQPQKRLVQPAELGALAAFLCRDEALGITMEDIQLNAGALWLAGAHGVNPVPPLSRLQHRDDVAISGAEQRPEYKPVTNILRGQERSR